MSTAQRTSDKPLPYQTKVYVRYLGSKVCWTLDGGKFYIGLREEMNPEDEKLCEAGGGYREATIVDFTVCTN